MTATISAAINIGSKIPTDSFAAKALAINVTPSMPAAGTPVLAKPVISAVNNKAVICQVVMSVILK